MTERQAYRMKMNSPSGSRGPVKLSNSVSDPTSVSPCRHTENRKREKKKTTTTLQLLAK